MGKIKVSRKELKRDELKDFGESIAEFYDSHQVKIWLAICLVAAVYISTKVWSNSQATTATETAQELNAALIMLNSGLASEDRAQREQFFDSAIRICDVMRIKRPGTRAARQALFMKGNAEFYRNDNQAAIKVFTEYRESADSADDLAQAHLALGYCHENEYFNSGMEDAKAYDNAATEFRLASNAAQSTHVKHEAMLSIARMNEVSGREKDVTAAIDLYSQIVEESEIASQREAERFDYDEEVKQQLAVILPPTASDLFDSGSRAKTQLERLEALLKAGETASLAERSKPVESPEGKGDDETAASAPSAETEAPAEESVEVIFGEVPLDSTTIQLPDDPAADDIPLDSTEIKLPGVPAETAPPAADDAPAEAEAEAEPATPSSAPAVPATTPSP